MAKCEQCGNDYDKAFEVRLGGKTHVFDSFECAIQKMAPECNHCGCKIIGHGVENSGKMFCCVNCARESGESSLRDRV
jgi:hypothetical protein